MSKDEVKAAPQKPKAQGDKPSRRPGAKGCKKRQMMAGYKNVCGGFVRSIARALRQGTLPKGYRSADAQERGARKAQAAEEPAA